MRFHVLASAVIAALLVVAAIPAPAAAQTPGDQRALCVSEVPATQIAACTAVIESGRAEGADLSNAYNNRGVGYAALGDHARAMADYNEAIRLDPRNAAAYNARAGSHVSLGDYALAIADYDQAIRLTPGDARPHYNRGLAYTRQRDYVRAIAGYDEAIRLDPQFAAPYNNRCMMRAMYLPNELDRARADCDMAVRLGAGHPRILTSRGFLNLRQGRFQDAWNDYDAAVRAQPDYADPHYGRGIAALRLGRMAEGLADIARAVELDGTVAQSLAGDWITP